jgi:hypothetical protein
MSKPDVDVLSIAGATALRKQLEKPPRLDLVENARAAANAASGRFVGRLVRAARGPGKVTPHEFFYYRLYDPALPEVALDRFVGKKIQHRMHSACNDAGWLAACHDKVLWSAILAGAKLPQPETIAMFGKAKAAGAGAALGSEDDLKGFITDPANHPLFCKPVDGINSLGAVRVEGVAGETLVINGGERGRIDDLVLFMSGFSPAGYMFQKVLQPHPILAPITGAAIASIRFLVLLTGEGPLVESAVIKLPTCNQVADNFWRSGNMLAAVDLSSGTITRAITGSGSNLKVIESEPASGTPLVGLAVPDFQAAQSFCLEAAAYFRGIRTQSWDVAGTANGPVLLEMNFGGDFNLHQLAHNRGILSDRYCRHLRACGYKRRLPAFDRT